jgi:NADH-quinone oxidoreductase subunit L
VLHRLLLGGWGFDWLYVHVVAGAYARLARLNRNDVVIACYRGVARFFEWGNEWLRWTVNGNVRWYVAAVAGGAAIVVGVAVILW